MIEQLIITYKKKLNQNDLDTLILINENIEEYVDLTIIELSKKVHMSKSYLLKLSQKLGFSGYSEFKYHLKQATLKTLSTQSTNDAQHLLMNDIEATNDLLLQMNFKPTVLAIKNAQHIFCYGTGASQQNILRQLSKNLMTAGKIIITLQTYTDFEANLTLMTENDLLIIASVSGENPNVLNKLHLLKLHKVSILAITQFKSNPIANIANYNLFFQTTPYQVTNSNNDIFSFVPLSIAVDLLLRHYIDYFNHHSS